MAWAIPQYKPAEVDAAGDALIRRAPRRSMADWEEYERAFLVINNWRSSHSFPLNTFQMGLRRNTRHTDPNGLVAQRIKRLSSIANKLRRMRNLKLSEMQDIGGCRAVVESVNHVREVVGRYKTSALKHHLIDEDDYILNPKPSGYRGYHLIYRYNSDRKTTYNGLKIELQIRSPLQHAWATAVETVDTFTHQALKSSSGEADWLRFFALMGTAIANRERTPHVPATPGPKKDLVQELSYFATTLQVETKLLAYGDTLRTVEQGGALADSHYFLVVLNPAESKVTVTGFRARELEKASDEYLATERAISEVKGADAVLVSVDSLAALKRAYPNYFFDTDVFLSALRRALA
ncbi:MAG TPA: RelA/SpoT domain-containing protein [Thermoanaerobaculia bacterium]|jgi:ppGpp synthetase/RelA/SpoT-type nucleotidyltranferase|nr:RelA/SpoT domain-containing protein [Thermoanaerobaculia bacterium]